MKKKIIIQILIIILVILISLLVSKSSYAADDTIFQSGDFEWIWEKHGNYVLGIPPGGGLDGSKPLPMIVYLHGSGAYFSEDSIIDIDFIHGLTDSGLYKFNAYIILPIGSADVRWGTTYMVSRVKKAMDTTIEDYKIDTDRVAVIGDSRGGTGALQLANSLSSYFSKCVAVSPYTYVQNNSIPTITITAVGDSTEQYHKKNKQYLGENAIILDGPYRGHHGGPLVKEMIEIDDGSLRVRSRTEITVQT